MKHFLDWSEREMNVRSREMRRSIARSRRRSGRRR